MREKKYILVLVLMFLVLGIWVRKLGLSLDDAHFSFPIADRSYAQHTSGYLKQYSFFRALALVYYFLVYRVFFRFPGLAHLALLAVFVALGHRLYRVLRLQKLRESSSLVTMLLILSIPFWVEAFGWFAAGTALLVSLFFFREVWLIESKELSAKTKWRVFGLQLASTFLYETVVFMPVALAFLWCKRQGKSVVASLKTFIGLVLFWGLPNLIYLGLRWLSPPTVETRIKLVGVRDIVENWKSFLNGLGYLLGSDGVAGFWLKEGIQGAGLLLEKPVVAILFVLLLGMAAWSVIKDSKDEKESRMKKRVGFWFLCLVLSLLPLSLQRLYLPFRTLVLSSSLAVVVIAAVLGGWRTHKILAKTAKLLVVLVSGFLLLVQIGMMNSYKEQYLDDKKIAQEIEKNVRFFGYNWERHVNIMIINFPYNTLPEGDFIYGEYILSMFYRSFWAQSFYAINAKSWQEIGVETPDGFSAGVGKNEFEKLRPLIVLDFLGKEECRTGKCFKVDHYAN